MNESSVSSPFMKALRQGVPGIEVVKHRDASMIGLPDASATSQQRVLWMEFKLVPWAEWMEGKTDTYVGMRLLETCKKGKKGKASAQYSMVISLQGLYLIWVRKTACFIVDPIRQRVLRLPSGPSFVAQHFVRLFGVWEPSPMPDPTGRLTPKRKMGLLELKTHLDGFGN